MTDSNEATRYTVSVPMESMEKHQQLVRELASLAQSLPVPWYTVRCPRPDRVWANKIKGLESDQIWMDFAFLSEVELNPEQRHPFNELVERYTHLCGDTDCQIGLSWSPEEQYQEGVEAKAILKARARILEEWQQERDALDAAIPVLQSRLDDPFGSIPF